MQVIWASCVKMKYTLLPVFILWSWVKLRGCQERRRPPCFLSDKCKAANSRAETKESDLVCVARIVINNKCQMLKRNHTTSKKIINVFPLIRISVSPMFTATFFLAKYTKETRYGYYKQYPLPRGNWKALADVKSPCFSSGWFPRNLGSAWLKPHQQQKPPKVKAAALKVGQIEGEADFTTILSLAFVLY